MYQDWINQQKDYLTKLEDWQIRYLKQYTDDGHKLLRDVTLEFVKPFDWDDFRVKIGKGHMYYYYEIFYNLSYLLRDRQVIAPRQIGRNFSVENLIKHYQYFKNEDYKKVIMRIKKIITNIIKRAPPAIEDMILYRGTEDAYFIVEGTNEYSSPNIISTSLSRRIATEFINKSSGCCLKIISVPKGTSALYLEPITVLEREEEVILLPNTKFTKQSDEDGKIYYMDITD